MRINQFYYNHNLRVVINFIFNFIFIFIFKDSIVYIKDLNIIKYLLIIIFIKIFYVKIHNPQAHTL